MALYRLEVTVITAGAGHSIVFKAAYNARTRLRAEMDGKTADFSHRTDLLHEELLNSYGRSREELWNLADAREGNPDYGVRAREVLVALPRELTLDQQIELARELAQHIAERYGVAVDLAVHGPDPQGTGHSLNPHAHILFTRRRIDELGLGKTLEMWDRDLRGYERREADTIVEVPRHHELKRLRAEWASMVNRTLERASRPARVDERSYAKQGIIRVPGGHLGKTLHRLEQQGIPTEVGDYNRRAEWANRLSEFLGPEWDPWDSMQMPRTKDLVMKEVRAIKTRILGGLQEMGERREAEKDSQMDLLPDENGEEIERIIEELRAMLERVNPEFSALIREELDQVRERGRDRDGREGPSR